MTELTKSTKSLVVKGVDRILAINSRHEEIVTNKVYPWQTLRKDVNVVVAKIFHKQLRSKNRLRVRAPLIDVQEEAQALVRIAQ